MKPLKPSVRAAIRKELLKLRKRHGPVVGILTPAVVEAARSPESPLHEQFEWDDSIAGEKWRLTQARSLVQTFLIEQGPLEGQREWTSVIIQTENDPPELEHVYVDTTTVLNDPELRAQVLKLAIAEIQGWAFRYSHLKELRTMCNAISKFLKTFV